MLIHIQKKASLISALHTVPVNWTRISGGRPVHPFALHEQEEQQEKKRKKDRERWGQNVDADKTYGVDR